MKNPKKPILKEMYARRGKVPGCPSCSKFLEIREIVCKRCGQLLVRSKDEIDSATEKQLDFIKDIEDELGIKFSGQTKSEASMFISKHLDTFKDASSARNTWAIVNGYD